MHIWIIENNLMWSSKLQRSAVGFGHTCEIITELPESRADAAIINLGGSPIPIDELIPALRARGVKIVAHAGHKEKELLELGKAHRVDRLVTNGELTHKFQQIFQEF